VKREAYDMLSQFGLAAGAAGWKSAHIAVLSGALRLTRDYPDRLLDGSKAEPVLTIERVIQEFAAAEARAYMREVVCREELTPAHGVQIFTTYMYAFVNGALDAASANKPNFW
jgi:hypothetical protein